MGCWVIFWVSFAASSTKSVESVKNTICFHDFQGILKEHSFRKLSLSHRSQVLKGIITQRTHLKEPMSNWQEYLGLFLVNLLENLGKIHYGKCSLQTWDNQSSLLRKPRPNDLLVDAEVPMRARINDIFTIAWMNQNIFLLLFSFCIDSGVL